MLITIKLIYIQKISIDDSGKQNQCPSPYPSPVSSKSPTRSDLERNEQKKLVIENHQSQERLTPTVFRPSQDGPNDKNLQPVVSQVTPIQSPNRLRMEDSAMSATPTSDLGNETVILRSGDATEDEDDEDDDEEDVRELEGRTVTAGGQMVRK